MALGRSNKARAMARVCRKTRSWAPRSLGDAIGQTGTRVDGVAPKGIVDGSDGFASAEVFREAGLAAIPFS